MSEEGVFVKAGEKAQAAANYVGEVAVATKDYVVASAVTAKDYVAATAHTAEHSTAQGLRVVADKIDSEAPKAADKIE